MIVGARFAPFTQRHVCVSDELSEPYVEVRYRDACLPAQTGGSPQAEPVQTVRPIGFKCNYIGQVSAYMCTVTKCGQQLIRG
jgi:hypothetical protein